MISLVPRDEVLTVWPQVAPFIEGALSHSEGFYTLIDVFEEIVVGRQSLWIAFDAEGQIKGCCTVRVIAYPQGKVLNLELIGGEGVDEWLDDGAEVLNRYAADMGCRKMIGRGRPGWEPRIKKYGWKRAAIFFERNVER